MPVVQPSAAKSPRSETVDAFVFRRIVVVQLATGVHVSPVGASTPASSPPVRLGSCADGQPASRRTRAETARRTAERASSYVPAMLSSTFDSCLRNASLRVAD